MLGNSDFFVILSNFYCLWTYQNQRQACPKLKEQKIKTKNVQKSEFEFFFTVLHTDATGILCFPVQRIEALMLDARGSAVFHFVRKFGCVSHQTREISKVGRSR